MQHMTERLIIPSKATTPHSGSLGQRDIQVILQSKGTAVSNR